jgi:hypothetical protein
MISEAIAACHVIHAAEVGEEGLKGGEISPAQDAVTRAELMMWRLKRIREI